MTDVFSEKLDAWRDYTATPWARIRYSVVEETLRRETSRLGSGLRILDVGGGDARDSLPLARAGHDVTVMDQSDRWLQEAALRAAESGASIRTVLGDLADPPDLGEFDAVLCHFVLHYRPAGIGDLAWLAGRVRRGGFLSVMVPNPVGMVLRQLVVDGPAAALKEMGAETKRAVTFDHDVRKILMEEMESGLEAVGLKVVRRYGTRIANDLITYDANKGDPGYFDDLLRLELELCDLEPFIRVGAMYQLIATKA